MSSMGRLWSIWKSGLSMKRIPKPASPPPLVACSAAPNSSLPMFQDVQRKREGVVDVAVHTPRGDGLLNLVVGDKAGEFRQPGGVGRCPSHRDLVVASGEVELDGVALPDTGRVLADLEEVVFFGEIAVRIQLQDDQMVVVVARGALALYRRVVGDGERAGSDSVV